MTSSTRSVVAWASSPDRAPGAGRPATPSSSRISSASSTIFAPSLQKPMPAPILAGEDVARNSHDVAPLIERVARSNNEGAASIRRFDHHGTRESTNDAIAARKVCLAWRRPRQELADEPASTGHGRCQAAMLVRVDDIDTRPEHRNRVPPRGQGTFCGRRHRRRGPGRSQRSPRGPPTPPPDARPPRLRNSRSPAIR